MSDDIDWEALSRLGHAFQALGDRIRNATLALTEFVTVVSAARGLEQLEMELKLRSEMELRTDLLSLHDPEQPL